MSVSTEAGRSVQPPRPGRTDGVCSEFTVFAAIKPGHAQALREVLAGIAGAFTAPGGRAPLRQVGTLHDARHVIFGDDRWLLFASVFDGSWDTYIDDFAKTDIGVNFEKVFAHTEGFPGVADAHVKDWFVARQAPAGAFVSSYPDLTVQQIWKDQRVNDAFQAVLDTPEFRAALDDPANAALVASPAFRKLLDEASV
jgi:hypothetical protein